jgi:hypothetical protein
VDTRAARATLARIRFRGDICAACQQIPHHNVIEIDANLRLAEIADIVLLTFRAAGVLFSRGESSEAS